MSQKLDPFRKQIGHVSMDRFIVSDDASRRRSQQQNSSSQSQSQAMTPVFSSLGNSVNESQSSSGLSKYEDMHASGRHLEIKDSLEAIRKNVIMLNSTVSATQEKTTNNVEEMKQIISSVQSVKNKQDEHNRTLNEILDVLKSLKGHLGSGNCHIPFDLNLAGEGDADSVSDPISPLSEDGISLNDYLNTKRQRTHASAASTAKFSPIPSAAGHSDRSNDGTNYVIILGISQYTTDVVVQLYDKLQEVRSAVG